MLLNLYIIAAVLGGGLALAGAFAGHHDGSIDHGSDHDSDHGGDGQSDVWIPFFSLRFWTYGLFAFGLLGGLLHLTHVLPGFKGLPLASGFGLAVGLGVSYLMRLLKKGEEMGGITEKDLRGGVGTVTVAIRPDSDGKVRIAIGGELLDLLARGERPLSAEVGEEVVILSMENDRALVMRKSDVLGNENV